MSNPAPQEKENPTTTNTTEGDFEVDEQQQLVNNCKMLTSASLRQRKAAVEELARKPPTSIDGLESLVDAYFDTLFVYSDSYSVRLVANSMAGAFQRAPAELRSAAIEHFVRRIASVTKSIKPAPHPRYVPHNTLLNWSLILIQENLEHFQNNSTQLALLLNSQSQLLAEMTPTQLAFAKSNFTRHFVLDHSKMADLYFNQIKSSESANYVFFFGYLLSIFSTKQITDNKDVFLTYYNKVVLSSTPTSSIDKHRLFTPIFKLLDLQDFTSILMPTLSRFIKRSQEDITHVLFLILENTSFDLSTLTKSQLIPMLIPVLQVTTLNKKLIKKVFNIVTLKTKEAKIIQSSIDDIVKGFTTPGNLHLKLNTIYALGAIVLNNFEVNEKVAIVKSVLTPLTTYLEKEFTKINRIQGFKLIGDCLSLSDQLLSDQLVKLINTILKSDDDQAKSRAILALSKSFGVNVDFKKMEKKCTQINTSFSETVLNVLKQVKNPQTCETGSTTAALTYFLAIIRTPNCSFSTKLQSDKVLMPMFVGNTAFVYQPTFLNRTQKSDQVAPLIGDIISSLKLLNAKPNDRSAYQSIVQLLIHSQWKTRHAAQKIIDRLYQENPELSNILFLEFAKIIESHSTTAIPANPLSVDVYSAALKATLSRSFDAKNYPSLALLSNHPLIGKCWNSCLTILGTSTRELFATHADLAREVVQYLFTNGLNNRRSVFHQHAFTSAMATFTRNKCAQVVETSIPSFVRSIQITPITSLTPLQLGIHAAEEGVLYSEKPIVDEKARAEQERIASEIRRGKTAKKKTPEEEKAEELKRKAEEKKKKESGEDERLEKEKQRQIAEQSNIRKEVATTLRTFQIALDTVDQMAKSSPLFAGEYLSILYLPILDLFKNQFTGEWAQTTYRNMTVCIPRRLKIDLHYATMVTYLISNIYATPVLSDIQILSSIQKVLINVRDISKSEPLPASAFNFFWPIIKNGLEKTVSYTIQELSMEIIEKHTSQGQPYPRGSMIAALIVVVATSPRLETQARASIFQIINGVEESDIKELMEGLISPHHQVRSICLQGVEKIPAIYQPSFQWEDDYIGKLWFVKYDPESSVSSLADKIWNSTNQTPPTNRYLQILHQSIFSPHDEVRKLNIVALTAAAKLDTASIRTYAIEPLIKEFSDNIAGEVRDTKEMIHNRRSIARALSGVGAAFESPEDLTLLFEWIINTGLYDSKQEVVQEAIQAGMTIIAGCGQKFSSELLKIFEGFLSRPDSGNADEDSIRASVVVLMGSLAKHMEDTNPKVVIILDKLIEALSTPSEDVQQTISKCMTQLLSHFKKQGERVIPILLTNIKMGTDYADRKGNAFGLAGAIKGLGISSLKTYNIMATLTSFVEDKKHPTSRQGSLFAFECLCNTLGRVFEPYVIQIIPKLLVCFGDSSAEVRVATSETARAIMSQLSGHGVKIVLPALLKALDDRQWRTKEGSIELLGAMAFCAPKQLSACLPTIVPKLTNVLNDTHIKVQEAAKEALSHIGSVIRNPEIQIHVPLLLKTYNDPDLYSRELLENLLNTNYIHTIDAASLSLMMPILERTLKERSSEIKKMTCQIVGNLCSLTDPKELIPYLAVLMPTLQNVLLDPIPEVRAICARALGLLVRGMGEENFTTLVPWLLETVKSEAGPVERSGAAQGLSEVLASLDISRFNNLINELLTMANSPRSHVREGVMSMFIFSPISFGASFLPYLPRVLPQVLKGLADDSDPVREVCMRCGQSIINQFAVSGIEVIVPSLERVLFHENWRIRLSCVQLFGDLLFKLGGSTSEMLSAINEPPKEKEQPAGKMSKKEKQAAKAKAALEQQGEDGEEDENDSSQTKNEIYTLLGKERLDRILSSLYMMRFDNNTSVRQKVLLIWKYVVDNTPKTLREILPSLIEMIISSIGSSNIDKRQIAARTLGDVVSKLGDRILPEILPILEKGLLSKEEETRQGVCIGLTEVISSARAQLQPYLPSVVHCITRALCDPLIDVREAAAKAFDQLHSCFSSKASNEILPTLIQKLDSTDVNLAKYALDGLRQIVLIKSVIVLPYIVPKLLVRPISTSNAQALASLASDAGQGLHNHLPTMIPALIEAFTADGIANGKEIKSAAVTICKSIDSEGLEIIIPLLVEQTESGYANTRLGASELIGEFCGSTTLDFDEYIDSLIVALLKLFNDSDKKVQIAANHALLAITKTIKKDNLRYLQSVHEGVQDLEAQVDSVTKTIPAFCIPKGLAPVLSVLLNGLRYGTADQRELATNTLHTVISLTSQDSVKTSAMEMTGPLILTIGDKFPHGVKSAILQTLSLLIVKCPMSMKIFLPQLQPTFIKALADPHKNVRNAAASALGLLMTLSPSVDQLVNSLLLGISTSDATSQEVKLKALQSIFEKKPKIDQANLDKTLIALSEFLYGQSDELRHLAAQVIGSSSKCFSSADALNQYIKSQLLSPSGSVIVRYGKSLSLSEVVKASGSEVTNSSNINQIISTCQVDLKDDKAPIRESAALLSEYILRANPTHAAELLPSLCQLITDPASSVAINTLNIVKRFSKAHPSVVRQYLSLIVPPTMLRLKERSNLPLKLSCERTLVHALQIFQESVVMDDYLKTVTDSALSNSLLDYHKRILIKLAPDSDTENEKSYHY